MTRQTASKSAAAEIKVGDVIADSKKVIIAGNGVTVGKITRSRDDRVQLRHADGKIIRSCAPDTQIWVGSEPVPAASPADKLAANDAEIRQGVTPKPAAKPNGNGGTRPKHGGLTKAQLTKAAAMRADGATWNAIRAAFKVKLGSSAWFRAWEAESIEHIPAGERVKPEQEPTNGKAGRRAASRN